MRGSRSGGAQGFILVVVLWMLVAIAITTGFLLEWSRSRIDDARASRIELEDRIAALGTRDTLVFMASTGPMTIGGLPVEPLSPAELSQRRLDEFGGLDKTPRGNEIRLDDQAYQGLGGIRLQVQDEAGLVPFGRAVGLGTEALLVSAGVPRAERGRLLAALEDHVDAGTQAEQPPPAGRPLLFPREVWHIDGWAALPEDARRHIDEGLTVAYSGALNLNTAPLALLEAMAVDCMAMCRARLAGRSTRPFASGAAFDAETGARLPGDRDIDFRTAPSETLRLTLTGRGGRAWRMHVRLTPLAHRAGPWAFDAAYRISLPRANDVPQPIPSPLFAATPMD